MTQNARDMKFEKLIADVERLRDVFVEQFYRDRILKKHRDKIFKKHHVRAKSRVNFDERNQIFFEKLNDLLLELYNARDIVNQVRRKKEKWKARRGRLKKFLERTAKNAVNVVARGFANWASVKLGLPASSFAVFDTTKIHYDDGRLPDTYLDKISREKDLLQSMIERDIRDKKEQMNFTVYRSREKGKQKFSDIFRRRYRKHKKILELQKIKKIKPVLDTNMRLPVKMRAQNLIACLKVLAYSGVNKVVSETLDVQINVIKAAIKKLYAMQDDRMRNKEANYYREWYRVDKKILYKWQKYRAKHFKKALDKLRLVCEDAEKLIMKSFMGFGGDDKNKAAWEKIGYKGGAKEAWKKIAEEIRQEEAQYQIFTKNLKKGVRFTFFTNLAGFAVPVVVPSFLPSKMLDPQHLQIASLQAVSAPLVRSKSTANLHKPTPLDKNSMFARNCESDPGERRAVPKRKNS